MKKTISTLKLIALGIILSVGISYAALWTGPTAAAPGGNVDAPITALVDAQEKLGNLSVNTFAALGNSALKQRAFFRGPVKGIDPGSSDPTLEIGGGATRVVTTVNGNLNSGRTIGSTELINNVMNPLCADDAGHVVLCTDTSSGTSMISGVIVVTGGKTVQINLTSGAPTNIVIPAPTQFDQGGSNATFDVNIAIAQGEALGSGGHSGQPYVCSVINNTADGTYVYQVGSVQYVLSIGPGATRCP